MLASASIGFMAPDSVNLPTAGDIASHSTLGGVLDLVEWVGSGPPVRKEHTKANGLEDAGQNTNGHEVDGSLLGHDLRDELTRVSI